MLLTRIRSQRLAALGAMVIASAASIATSRLDRSVHGFAVSTLFDLTAEHPVRTFGVVVDMNEETSVTPGGRRTLSINPMFSVTDVGAEVTVTISSDRTPSTSVVLKGRESGTDSIDVAPEFFAGCQEGQPCVRQGTVRFELRFGAGARGSFMAQAMVRGFVSDPPAGAAITVTLTEQAP